MASDDDDSAADSPELPPLPELPLAKLRDALEEDGYCVLRGVPWLSELAARVEREVARAHARGELAPSCNRLATARDAASGAVVDGAVLAKRGVHELDVVVDGRVAAPATLAASPALGALVARDADALVAQLNDAHGGLLLTGVDQLKLQYNEGVGGCFPMHYDTTGDRSRRALTLLLYCTDDWRAPDGGELRLFPFPYAPVDVAPERGCAALFSSTEMLHRVLPSLRPRTCLP